MRGYLLLTKNRKLNKASFSKYEAEVRLRDNDAMVSDIKMPKEDPE